VGTQGAVATHNSLGAMGAPPISSAATPQMQAVVPYAKVGTTNMPPSIVSLLLLATNATLLLGLHCPSPLCKSPGLPPNPRPTVPHT